MFSKRTKNLGLPLFDNEDRALWTDINYGNNILDESYGATDASVKDIVNVTIPEIQSELSTLSSEVDTVNTEIVSLKSRVTTVENKIGTADIGEIQRQLTSLTGNVSNLQTEMNTFGARIETVKGDVQSVMNKVQRYGVVTVYSIRDGGTVTTHAVVDTSNMRVLLINGIYYLNGIAYLDGVNVGEAIPDMKFLIGLPESPIIPKKILNTKNISYDISFVTNLTQSQHSYYIWYPKISGNYLIVKQDHFLGELGITTPFARIIQFNMCPIGTI